MTSNLIKRILLISIYLFLFFSIKLYSQKIQSALLTNGILVIESEGIAYLGSGITESDAKTIAINYAKRNALEQAGTYLESHTEVLNFTLVKDEVITYTGGLVRVKILRESRDLVNNLFAFKVYIEATIDIKILNDRIKELRNNRELKKQLESERERSNQLASKIAELQTLGNQASETEVKKIISSLSASEWNEKGSYAQDIKFQIRYFTKAIELDTKYAAAYFNRGSAYLKLDRQKDAIQDYTTVINLRPQFEMAYYNRGTSYAKLGQHDDAIRDYTKAIELDEQHTDVYYNRGNAHLKLGQHNDAIRDYTKAIELDEQYIDAYNNRGAALENLGRHKDAIQDYTTAIKLDTHNIKAYYNRGAAYWKLSIYKNAADDFNEYLKLNGNKRGDADKVRQWIKDLGFKPKY